jgi:hypothetical protein
MNSRTRARRPNVCDCLRRAWQVTPKSAKQREQNIAESNFHRAVRQPNHRQDLAVNISGLLRPRVEIRHISICPENLLVSASICRPWPLVVFFVTRLVSGAPNAKCPDPSQSTRNVESHC